MSVDVSSSYWNSALSVAGHVVNHVSQFSFDVDLNINAREDFGDFVPRWSSFG